MKRAFLLAPLLLAIACGRTPAPKTSHAADIGRLPDVRTAPGRPPVVLVTRDGDPSAAIAFAAMIGESTPTVAEAEGAEPAAALAGIVESRLHARGVEAEVTPSWDGVRASVLAPSEAEATRIAVAMTEVLGAPITEADLAPARKKLSALALRPLWDATLTRWARCVGALRTTPAQAAHKPSDLDVAKLERWRSSYLGLGHVAISVAGTSSVAEAVAEAVLGGKAWRPGATLGSPSRPMDRSVDVFELGAEPGASSPSTPALFMTLDVGSSSAAVATAEALGDPRGPLAARLAELDLPFRLRDVVGTAHVSGGCVGVVLEPSSSPWATPELAARVADAAALVHLEASVQLAEVNVARDGRLLSRRAGDSREAAERAAWWALVDQQANTRPLDTSVRLGIPPRRGGDPKADAQPVVRPVLEPTSEALATAVSRAREAWDKPVIESRARVESGQGEVWVLVGSPCGTESETESDSGLTALFATAATESVKTTHAVRVEPWVVPDGAGVLVHGPPLSGEAPVAHARRIAEIAARSFAAEPLSSNALVKARSELLRRDERSDGGALTTLALALAPQHPSWVIAWGASDPLARSSDAAISLRAQALRSGPIRMAILANADNAQADAALRVSDRWVTRRAGQTRACRAPTAALPARPGTYTTPLRPGAVPEAYLAFPFAAGDEHAHLSASVIAAALDGEGGLLERALSGIARESSVRVLGYPRAPALVIRVVAPQASLDSAVMQTRALIDRVHKGGLLQPDFDRATSRADRNLLRASLDPRTRVIATWRGESIGAKTRATREDARVFAQRSLGEETMIVVASRPARPAGGT